MAKSFQDQLHVLVVEDNDLNAKFAEAVMKKLNFQVDVASNGNKGVEKFLENDYDLILMDIQMPILNGLDASVIIRKLEKQLSTENPIVIIAVTAFASEHDRSNCLANGMDDYLTKPFKPSDLTDIIKKYFPI